MYSGRRFFIIDPSLSDIRGHHYTLTSAVTDSARAQGFEVKWLSSMKTSEALERAPEILPTFDLSMYDSYVAKPKPIVERIFTWINRKSAPKAEVVLEEQFAKLERSLFEGLVKAIEDHDIGPADRLLFHTADGVTYRVLARLIEALPKDNLPLFHVCTPYDPVGVMPNRASADLVADAVEAFKAAELLDRRVFLYGENPYLAEHLSEVWNTRVRPLDLPAEAPSESEKRLACGYRSNVLGLEPECFMITSLGAARVEKGFHLFPDIIRRTFEYAGTAEYPNAQPERIKFVLQASEQIIGRHPVLAKAIAEIEEMPKTRVELLIDPLGNVDFRNLLLASDAVMLPYDEAAYRVRGSGVVVEALAAQKFLIAKPGSYPGSVATLQGGETGETPVEIAKGLLSIIHKRGERFEAIQNAAIEYVSANKTHAYVEKILAAEREDSVVKATDVICCIQG